MPPTRPHPTPSSRGARKTLSNRPALAGHGRRPGPARVTIRVLFDRHPGAAVAIGATLRWEATIMRYALLMHYREPGEGEISEEAIEAAKEAFGAYGRAL